MIGVEGQDRTPRTLRPLVEDRPAEHTPTLAPAPEGLSARRVERWLDLPEGAWQRRHLYALRLKGSAFSHLGLREGDLVVIEPGAREQPGRIVVTRSVNGLSLRRVAAPAHVGRRMPTVLELPLKERVVSHPEHVVGTVLGLLRPTGTGALRPARLPLPVSSQRRSRRKSGSRRPGPEPLPNGQDPVSLEHLSQTRDLWRNWLSMVRESAGAHVTAEESERWERLDASLATLCDCLSRTHSPVLRAALADQAGEVVAAIHAEMRG